MFAKVYNQIFASSIAENYTTRHVFMDLLVLADSEGVVDMTMGAIARTTNVPLEVVKRAIQELSEPDTESRSAGEDGRRIALLDSHRDWGWRIINYAHYRSLRDEEARRSYNRNYMRKYRNGEEPTEPVKSVKTCKDRSTSVKTSKALSTHAEAEGEGEESSSLPFSEEMRKVQELWNQLPRPIGKVVGLSTERRKALRARLSDPWWRENYPAAIERIGKSKFCRGEIKGRDGRTWKANFDFFLRPESALKALEGKYDNDKTPACES